MDGGVVYMWRRASENVDSYEKAYDRMQRMSERKEGGAVTYRVSRDLR